MVSDHKQVTIPSSGNLHPGLRSQVSGLSSFSRMRSQASVAQCKDDQESYASSEADLAAAVVALESAVSKVSAQARWCRPWETHGRPRSTHGSHDGANQIGVKNLR